MFIKTENTLVTIIVPNYNHEKYLKERLDSIFDQTYLNFEVVLLDDCSTDNSRDILCQYSRHPKVSHCVFNEINSGNTFVQWSKGLQLAKGEYIWIAESDDFCEPNFLEEVIKPMLENKEIVLSYCQSNKVNQEGVITGNWITHTQDLDPTLFLDDFSMDSNVFIEEFLICRNVIPNASAVVFKKSAVDIERHLEIAHDFRYCGDWIFYIKLIMNNKVAFVNDSLNNFRYHENSVIANVVKTENKISIIDTEYKIRKHLMQYLKHNDIINYTAIKNKNSLMKRKNLTYEKVSLLVRSGSKIKGYLLLLSVLDLFYKNYKFKENIKIKIKRLIE
jgi:glycosyltransferase involved in cell wall biosynthesis